MDKSPVDVVVGQLAAYNARDVEGFVTYYSADAVIDDGTGRELMRGAEAIRAFYARLFAQSPNLWCAVPQRMFVGPYVVDEELVTGIQLEGFPSGCMPRPCTESRTGR